MKMFLARDEDGMICLHFEEPPQRTIYERTVVWRNESEWGSVELRVILIRRLPMKILLSKSNSKSKNKLLS